MPIAKVRGANINYKVLGDHGPWVALSPGGRRDISGIDGWAGNIILLTNSAMGVDDVKSPLTISGITQNTGNVTVTNTGAIATVGAVTTAANGNISLTATNGSETIGLLYA